MLDNMVDHATFVYRDPGQDRRGEFQLMHRYVQHCTVDGRPHSFEAVAHLDSLYNILYRLDVLDSQLAPPSGNSSAHQIVYRREEHTLAHQRLDSFSSIPSARDPL
jgi:hypothetical protein